MCGIVGIVGNTAIAPQMMGALSRMEYRGYDSAGVATLEAGRLTRRRAEGKLTNLERMLAQAPLVGTIGIGHTRWATHGRPNETNAHPHATAHVAVVHNGIVENFSELRNELERGGVIFSTETDTEVIAHLVTKGIESGQTPVEAVSATLPRLQGTFALVFLFDGQNDLLIGARRGSPLAIGYGKDAMYLGSDALALSPFTDTICYLEDGDWALLTRAGAQVRNASGELVQRPVVKIDVSSFRVDKGSHRHFMAKEIYEQPAVIADTLAHYLDPATNRVTLPATRLALSEVKRTLIAACGTAYYAGLVGKHWFEKIARLNVEIDIASEFRHRDVPIDGGDLFMSISQSGETADTLATLRLAKQSGRRTLSIVNVSMSSIARESDVVLPTLAGPEVGVASTKAFTCQLAVLACLTIAIARARGTLTDAAESALVKELLDIPNRIATALKVEPQIAEAARMLAESRDVLYLGRGLSFPLALEGALKLKEISYIHAEGYAAGELKHGPIALIDNSVPVVVLAPYDDVFAKTVSNIQEVAARGGRVILITDARGAQAADLDKATCLVMPDVPVLLTPLVYAIPLQLLAYHAALIRGANIDQPRNLAKSVTVE